MTYLEELSKRKDAAQERGDIAEAVRLQKTEQLAMLGDMTTVAEAKSEAESCDNCEHQEEGGHYCLMHGKQMRDMNCHTCPLFSENSKH